MNKKEFQFFLKTLLRWHEVHSRHHLPWRKKNITAYEVWVSEVMLQQTQVSRVIDFYKKFLKRFPNVSSLARASWEEFLPYYQGLGYYRRGENMLKTAKIIKNEHGGRFPKHKKELLKLPGIGEYTACAILSFAYGERVIAPDTNVKRILFRYFPEEKNTQVSVVRMEKFLETSEVSANKFNSVLMDFGSLVCAAHPQAKNHVCPFDKYCRCFKGVLQKTHAPGSCRETFSYKNAEAYIFLHENHRRYFSENKKEFKPFILPRGEASREAIKKYFLEKYKLNLAVRPPFKKVHIKDKPAVFVNAQILSGSNQFFVHSKKNVEDFKKYVYEKL